MIFVLWAISSRHIPRRGKRKSATPQKQGNKTTLLQLLNMREFDKTTVVSLAGGLVAGSHKTGISFLDVTCFGGLKSVRHGRAHRSPIRSLPLLYGISSTMFVGRDSARHPQHGQQLDCARTRESTPPHRIVRARAEACEGDACPALLYPHAHELELRLSVFIKRWLGPAADDDFPGRTRCKRWTRVKK